mgnify:CR=1 FL=1
MSIFSRIHKDVTNLRNINKLKLNNCLSDKGQILLSEIHHENSIEISVSPYIELCSGDFFF